MFRLSLQISRHRLQILLALLAFLLHSNALQAEALTSMQLYYRPAAEVVEQVRALFPEADVKISGLDHQIILRAKDNATLVQVQQVIRQLDVRPHQFRISLRRSGASLDQDQGIGASGSYSTRRVSPDGSSVQITTRSSRISTRSQNAQTITVMEGTAVLLQQGQLRPVRDLWIGSNGVATATHYQQLGDALVLSARLVGDGQVEISVRASHAVPNDSNNDSLDQLQLVTQRIVSPGTWVELGAVQQSQQSQNSGVIHYSTHDSSDQGSYQVSVELAD